MTQFSEHAELCTEQPRRQEQSQRSQAQMALAGLGARKHVFEACEIGEEGERCKKRSGKKQGLKCLVSPVTTSDLKKNKCNRKP